MALLHFLSRPPPALDRAVASPTMHTLLPVPTRSLAITQRSPSSTQFWTISSKLSLPCACTPLQHRSGPAPVAGVTVEVQKWCQNSVEPTLLSCQMCELCHRPAGSGGWNRWVVLSIVWLCKRQPSSTPAFSFLLSFKTIQSTLCCEQDATYRVEWRN